MENVLARELVSKWTASFQKGMEFDLWGQRLEATQFYQRCRMDFCQNSLFIK